MQQVRRGGRCDGCGCTCAELVPNWEVANAAMSRIGRLMALVTSCDALRFGCMLCIGAGEHVRFDGTYEALGESLDFAQTFGTGTPHGRTFHDYNAGAIRLYQHFSIRGYSGGTVTLTSTQSSRRPSTTTSMQAWPGAMPTMTNSSSRGRG